MLYCITLEHQHRVSISQVKEPFSFSLRTLHIRSVVLCKDYSYVKKIFTFQLMHSFGQRNDFLLTRKVRSREKNDPF